MSEVKVNKISPRSGTTVTLGDSGDTFTIPSGATINNQGTATNFGATGAASWNTTVKTGDFTAVAGEGYFVNTTSGAVNVTLPAGTAGAVVAIKDYANTFDTNAVTLTRNGSDKIGGQAINATLSTEGQAVTLVFVDSTQGWLVTDDGLQSSVPQPTFITATGGTITTSGNFKIHTFTGPGTFCVSGVGNPAGSTTADYLIIAGGAGGGGGCGTWNAGGGGGAGGYRESPGTASGCYSVSPLGTSPAVALPVSVQGYPITVGAGGAASSPNCNAKGSPGGVSTFSTITSAGGGGGGSQNTNVQLAANGGSGGGGGQADNPNPNYSCGVNKGTGNTPPVSPPQGNPGGNGTTAPPGPANGGGGGGGALSAGGNSPSGATGGAGGGGATSSINGTPTARAGGGGGAGATTGGAAGSGGGGAGNGGGSGVGAGTTNTGGGGGGGGGSPTPSGASGGSGIVIIRYKFQ